MRFIGVTVKTFLSSSNLIFWILPPSLCSKDPLILLSISLVHHVNHDEAVSMTILSGFHYTLIELYVIQEALRTHTACEKVLRASFLLAHHNSRL